MANKKKTTTRAGWGFPDGEKHAHFFIGGVSLCGDLEAFRGPIDTDMSHTSYDCARCRRMIATIVKLAA